METALDELAEGYRSHGDLLAVLKEAQARLGGLARDVVAGLAERLALPLGQLYGIVSFYSFLSTASRGRHTIRICQCVPCRLGQGDALRGAVEKLLGIRPGETTADGRFTLQLTNCIGACGEAPAMMIDERRCGALDEGRVAGLLAAFD